MSQPDACRMVRRHGGADWLPYLPRHGHHLFIANGGGLEHEQEMAADESPQTTKPNDRGTAYAE